MRITQKIFLFVGGAILSIGLIALLLFYYFLGVFFENMEQEQLKLVNPQLEHLFATISKTESKALLHALNKEYLFLKAFTENRARGAYRDFYQRHLNQSTELQALMFFQEQGRNEVELWNKNISFTKGHITLNALKDMLVGHKHGGFIPLLSKKRIEEGFAFAYYDQKNRAYGVAVFKKSAFLNLFSSSEGENNNVTSYLCLGNGDILMTTALGDDYTQVKKMFLERKKGLGENGFTAYFNGKIKEDITKLSFLNQKLYIYKQMDGIEHSIIEKFQVFGDKYLIKIMALLVGVMIIGLVLFFLVLWRIAIIVATPLEEVTAFSNKLARGEYDVSFAPKYTSKEIELLLKSLHFMRDQMQRSIMKLETSHSRESAARKEAEQANTVKSNFLVNMSRELRTPLNSILGLSQIIDKEIEQGKYDKKLKKKVEAIYKSAFQLNSLITGLLKLGNADDESEALDIADFATSDFLIDLTTTVNKLAEEKNVSVTCNYSSTMPQRLITDYNILQGIMRDLASVLLNLATEDSEVRLGCTYDSRWVSFWIELSQSDGNEFSLAEKFNEYMDDSRDLLPEFYNNDLLLLTVAQANTVLLGGEFIASSSEEVNSRFSINLRSDSVGMLLDTATQAFHSASNAQKATIELLNSSSFRRSDIVVKEEELGSITVLSAEDNLENQMLIEMMLKDTEFKLLKAKDGEECLSILSEQKVDLLLLDMQMPKVDGKGVLDVMQKDEQLKKLPVIVLTAHLDSKIKTYLDSIGIKGCYVKPINVEDLLNTMRKVIK